MRSFFPLILMVALASLFTCDGTRAADSFQTGKAIKVHLANGGVLSASSVKVEGKSLRLEFESGGTIWIEKGELSAQARHQFFGEPLPIVPSKSQVKQDNKDQSREVDKPPALPHKPAAPNPNLNKAAAAHTEPILKWTPADFPASSEPLPKVLPKDNEQARVWIVRYLLEKVGGTISVNAIPSLDENAWYCARLYDAAAKDAAAVLKLVAQHLLIVDHLLLHQDALQRRQGLVVAVQAARCARSSLKDMLLATAITDVYIIPNLDASDEREWVVMSKSGILEDVIATFSAAKEFDKLAAAYRLFIEHAPQHRADAARLKLAQLYQKQGQREKALEFLNEIKPTGSVRGGRNSIPRLEGNDSTGGGKRP